MFPGLEFSFARAESMELNVENGVVDLMCLVAYDPYN